jgi:hypothetical protein
MFAGPQVHIFHVFMLKTEISVFILLFDDLRNTVNRHRRISTDLQPKARVFARIGVLPSLAG